MKSAGVGVRTEQLVSNSKGFNGRNRDSSKRRQQVNRERQVWRPLCRHHTSPFTPPQGFGSDSQHHQRLSHPTLGFLNADSTVARIGDACIKRTSKLESIAILQQQDGCHQHTVSQEVISLSQLCCCCCWEACCMPNSNKARAVALCCITRLNLARVCGRAGCIDTHCPVVQAPGGEGA